MGFAVRQALFARHDSIDNIEMGRGGLKNRSLDTKLVDNWRRVSTVSAIKVVAWQNILVGAERRTNPFLSIPLSAVTSTTI